MSLRRRSLRPSSDTTQPLPWAPPPLTSPRLITVTDDPATRNIALAPGEDCLITAPTPIRFNTSQGTADAIVQIFGGRHVVWIGGHVIAECGPTPSTTSAVGAIDTAINVTSTNGFPATGYLRVEGEGIEYAGKTATSFIDLTRRSGYYNSASGTSDTTHPSGAVVYLGEYSRSAISRVAGTGHTHLEGILIDGFVNDCLRANRNSPLLTVQNCRFGPNSNHEPAGQSDGHPDVIQFWGGGVQEFRMARTTLTAGISGRAILNAAADGIDPAVGKIVLQDVDLITENLTSRLIENADTKTVWEVANTWLRTYSPKSYVCQEPSLAEKLGLAEVTSGVQDFCPAGVAGVGYVSPGYT